MDNKTSLYNTRSRLAIFEQLPKKDKNLKRKFPKNEESNNFESLDCDPLDCDLVIDTEDYSTSKKKVKCVKLKPDNLKLKCLWNNCSTSFTDYYKFMTHVQHHPFDDDSKSKVCLWDSCNSKIEDSICLLKHLSFHGYYERLKLIGDTYVSDNNLPSCHQNTTCLIPKQDQDYACGWIDCDETLVTYHDYLCHVNIHVHRIPKENNNSTKLDCFWKSCKIKFKGLDSLKKHIKTHTKEKVVACSSCGTTFGTSTKFYDHRKRQLPTQVLSYQCSHCSKLFANERLLRDHMRSHVNHYKCTMCEMTCTKPSTLFKHMRYRHLNERPYKCHLCKHASVTKNDLQQHLTVHCSENLMACEECDFRCRTIKTLDWHYTDVHNHDWRNYYQCHCCPLSFSRGNFLTKHLMKDHDFYWPSGHSKFRYKEVSDGYYRLETVRFESIEVTQEMMSIKVNEIPANVKPHIESEGFEDGVYKYKLTFKSTDNDVKEITSSDKDTKTSNNNNKKSFFSFIVSDGDKENIICPTKNEIEITIEDVDEEGNVVKSEKIKSNEMMCLPYTKEEGVDEEDNVVKSEKIKSKKMMCLPIP